jgi:hypothetical protein
VDGSTEPNEDNFLPAIVATGIWLGVGVALDVYLVVTNKSRLITDVLRTKFGKMFLTVLCLHVVNVLGRADPFRAAATVIQTKRGALVLVPVSDQNPSLSDAFTGE